MVFVGSCDDVAGGVGGGWDRGRFSQVGACLITRLFVRRVRVGLDPGQVSAAMFW